MLLNNYLGCIGLMDIMHKHFFLYRHYMFRYYNCYIHFVLVLKSMFLRGNHNIAMIELNYQIDQKDKVDMMIVLYLD